MIAVDTNILVYAHRNDDLRHARAREAIQSLIDSDEGWAVTWPSVHEFLAVSTNRRVFSRPATSDEAFAQIAALIEAGAILLGESDQHLATLTTIVSAAGFTGGAIHDARIAAICLDHGVRELWTADRDFIRIPRLRTRNPLV